MSRLRVVTPNRLWHHRKMDAAAAQKAMSLVQQGRVPEALDTMRAGQGRAEAACYFLEGLWLVEGRIVMRDLGAARTAFSEGAALGHVGAARSFSAMLACGVGGPPNWLEALALLSRWADRDAIAARQLALISEMSLNDEGEPTGTYDRRVINADPYIAMIGRVLTEEECDFLVTLGEPKLRRAMVFDFASNRFVEDDIRRSFTTGFPIISEWPFIRAINKRIAAATATDVACAEPLQILRYGPSDEYRAHDDSIAGMENPRVMTALVWLNADFAGGGTSFPRLNIEVRGRTGDLAMFRNTLPDGAPDPRMLHAGLPVTSGVKYLASRWIRARPAGADGFGRHEFDRARSNA